MSLIQNDNKRNKKLARLKLNIDTKLLLKNHDLNWIFQNFDSISRKVRANTYLKLNNPQLIGCTALHFALTNQNLHVLEILLSHGADFTVRNQNGSTALHLAIEQLYTRNCNVHFVDTPFEMVFVDSILTAHLTHDIFENPCDRNKCSHFHAACMINYRELVEKFIDMGVLINSAVSLDSPYFPGYTPLHFATNFFALETVEILLKCGADKNIKDAKGMSPLALLLTKSINYIKLMNSQKNTSLNISIEEVIKNRIRKIIKLFLDDSSDDVMVINEFGLSHFHLICTTDDLTLIEHYSNKVANINHCVNMNSPLCPGYTALHFTAFFSNIQSVKMLMRKGASMEAKEAKGITPFDICLETYENVDIHAILSLHPIWKKIVFSNGKTKLVDLILAMCSSSQLYAFFKTTNITANMFIPTTSTLWPGFTPLHLAVALSKGSNELTKFMQIIRVLYAYGADLNSQDTRGRTPLNLAFRQGKYDNVELLLSHRRPCEPVNIVDETNLTHLHILCYTSIFENSAHELMLNILNRVVNINIAYKGVSAIPFVPCGSSPLHVAIRTSPLWNTIPKLLLEHGADVLVKDSNGMTPVHLTLLRNDKEGKKFVRKILSTPSLRDSVIDDIQLSHLHVACYANHKNAVTKLIKQGADVNKAIVCSSTNETYSYFAKFDGFTPLRFAVMNGSKEISMLLIRHGADMFAREPNGMTPLYAALLNDHAPHIYVFALMHNVNLQHRIFFEHGITMLHIAICSFDIGMAKTLLATGANVNCQVFPDSPIWPGFTPLHVLTFYNQRRYSLTCFDIGDKGAPQGNLMEFLLQNGADITLKDSAHDTPLHIIGKQWTTSKYDNKRILHTSLKHAWLRMLLEAHQDFHVNPVNAEGMSYFHLACAIGEVSIVKKFLQHGEIDVNGQIDHFSEFAPGSTPLHLAIRTQCYVRLDLIPQLEIVDLLLSYGADVNIEDNFGNTPLHDAVNCHYPVCEDFLEMMVRNGADVNKHNADGETPLELLLKNQNIPIEKVKYFLKCGCRLNAINPVTGKNLWSIAVSYMTIEALRDLIFITSVNFPDLLEADEQGRKIIHNIVSVNYEIIHQWKRTEVYKYNHRLIKQILSRQCDVDDQDKLGRTALHFAAECFNHHGVSILLTYGADINIMNLFGQTAFSNAFQSNEERSGAHVYSTAQNLVAHVEQLLFCGFYVSQINREFMQRIRDKISFERSIDERFQKELEQIRNEKIGLYSLTVGDFLPGGMSDYPTMTKSERNVIDKYVESRDWHFFQKYSKVVGFILLQHRKAKVRVKMVKKARASLKALTKLRLPRICILSILKYLTNSELKNLIASVSKKADEN